MGPQLLPADVFRSVDVERSTSAKLRADETAGRFDDYLDEARSGPAAAASEEPVATSPSDQDRATGESDQEPDAADNQQGENAESAGAASEAVTGALAVAKMLASRAEAVVQADGTGVNRPDVSTESENTRQTVGVGRPRQIENGESQRPASDSVESGPSVRNAAGRVLSFGEQGSLEQANLSASPGKDDPARQSGSTDPRSEGSASRETPRRVESATQRGDRPVASEHSGATQAEPGKQARGENPHPVLQQETIYQRKVRESIDQRREGPADGRDARGRQRAAGPGGPDGASRSLGRNHLSARFATAVSELRSAVLRTGEGDGAAASIARFLVTAGPSGTAGTGMGQAATHSIGVGGAALDGMAHAGAAQASSAGLVGDLLAAGVEGADSIEGAARVLNASGGSGRHRVTLQLDPPELGQLKVQIHIHRQGVVLSIDTETPAVARLIESRLPELREALAIHGIRMDRADVVVRSPETAAADSRQHYDAGQPAQGDAGDAAADEHGEGVPDGGGAEREADGRGAYEEPGVGDAYEIGDASIATVAPGGGLENKTPMSETLVDIVV